MESFVYSVNASLPIFLTMAAGLGLRRLGLLDRHFADVAEQIAAAAHQVLEHTPPELAGDIYSADVVLTGGGSKLKGLDEYLSQQLKVKVRVSDDPINCVALGTARCLEIGDQLESGFVDATPRLGHR